MALFSHGWTLKKLRTLEPQIKLLVHIKKKVCTTGLQSVGGSVKNANQMLNPITQARQAVQEQKCPRLRIF